jgi:uncharacterized Zn finger protein
VLLIWGFKTYAERLSTLLLTCQRCSTPAAHHVVRYVRKFTLFFIPLFPVGRDHLVTCTYCGAESMVTQQQAEHYVTMAQHQAAPPQHWQGQPHHLNQQPPIANWEQRR